MAGGGSTRFWPLARHDRPKQLLQLRGRGTLLQQTARRLRHMVPWSRMVVVTNTQHAVQIRAQLPRLPAENVLVEPAGRGTAACLVLAAEWLRERVADAIMIATPADHVIEDAEAFRKSLSRAVAGVRRASYLVTIGAPASRPETGYGYIELGGKLPQAGLQRVARFREKPSAAVASRLIRHGNCVWNTGIFVWRVSDYLSAVQRLLPNTAAQLAGVCSSQRGTPARLQRAYRKLDNISVDSGILEPLSKTKRQQPQVAVVRAAFAWNDVGTWGSVGDLWQADEAGNAGAGKILPLDSSGCVIYAPNHLVVTLGVTDLVIVEAGDALLVCPRARAQDVRRIIPELRRRGLRKFL